VTQVYQSLKIIVSGKGREEIDDYIRKTIESRELPFD